MPYRLRLPPSNNELVRPAQVGPGVRLVSTKVASDFRKYAHAHLPVSPIGGPVELYVTVFVPTIASDGLNRIKALEDALNGTLWFDDKQVVEWHIKKVPVDEEEDVGVVFEVRPANPQEHSEAAYRLAKSSIGQQVAKRNQGALFGNVTTPVRPTAGVRSQQLADARGGGTSLLQPPTSREVPESIKARIRRLATPAVLRPIDAVTPPHLAITPRKGEP